jgi:hypothetical protein
VKHVELLSGVTAGVEHDSLFSSWVVWQEGSDVEDLSVDDDPDIILLGVLGDLIEGEGLGTSLRWLGLGLRLGLYLWLSTHSVNRHPFDQTGHIIP